MEKEKAIYSNIDEYILSCPPEVQEKLRMMRETIRDAAPEAVEKISYQMPTFVLAGNLVHFAAFKNHIGFYPTPSAIVKFNHELVPYQSSKGAVQFPLDQPLPLELIKEIVGFRVIENMKKRDEKKVKTKGKESLKDSTTINPSQTRCPK